MMRVGYCSARNGEPLLDPNPYAGDYANDYAWGYREGFNDLEIDDVEIQ